MSQVLSIIGWYLLLALLGWLVLPIAFRFFDALPGRGYAFIRPLGLLLWGFVFWLLSSFGLLANDRGGLLAALVLVAALSFWVARSLPKNELRTWLRLNRAHLISVEIVFALAFLFMLWVRASEPGIYHTEQPMEMAFINAILHSPSMPPHDPWLAGYSISYYYFGYLMVAMLAKVLGVAGAIAFNLGFVTIFATAAAAAYGLVYNLIALYAPKIRRSLHWWAGLAPLFVLLMGNAEGLLEIVHAQHLFWTADATGAQSSSFWAWMDIKDLVNPPTVEPRLQPRNYGEGSWWWWRASRVINDRTFSGGEQELIDEFPAFSYVLGDLHPHVLAMPFVLMTMAVALNLYLGGGERKEPLPLFGLRIEPWYLGSMALVVGALAFLNIWDLPIYAVLLASAYVLRRAQHEGWSWRRGEDLLSLIFVLGLGGVALFLPFYIGFTSQAAGFVPNLITPSRGTHLWVMFITLLTPILIFAISAWRGRSGRSLAKSMLAAFAFVALLWAGSLGLAWIYQTGIIPPLADAITKMGAPDFASLIAESLRRRFSASGGWLTIIFLLGIFGGLVFAKPRGEKGEAASTQQSRSFALLLAFIAALLVTAPEFIYLRDQFDTRMNMVFKFFIQAWLMWGVVAAYATFVIAQELRGVWRAVALAAVVLTSATGFVYPAYAFPDVAARPESVPLTLDGSAYLSQESRDVIAWLQTAQQGTVAEAVGGSYTGFARYATFSGQAGVMGWPGHEGQWRGGNVDFDRISNIEALYSTQSWDVAKAIIDQYGIDYVVVGDLERSAYQVNVVKFQQYMQLAYQSGQISVYTLP